jgi:hypothetical protein
MYSIFIRGESFSVCLGAEASCEEVIVEMSDVFGGELQSD